MSLKCTKQRCKAAPVKTLTGPIKDCKKSFQFEEQGCHILTSLRLSARPYKYLVIAAKKTKIFHVDFDTSVGTEAA